MCVLIFSATFSQTFLILRIIQRDIIVNVHASSCEILVILSCFNETSFLDRLLKNGNISNLMKICSVGAMLLHVDEETGRQKR
jgi:hypothetical protein